MALRTQLVSVPLGGGLGESVDPHRVQPPRALVAENAVLRQGESYRKAPGWAARSGGSTGTAGSKVAVSHADKQLLVLGQEDASRYDALADAWADYGPGHISPVGVESFAIDAPRGAVHDVSVAYHPAGYHAVIYKTIEDATNPNATDEFGVGFCRALIFNADWDLVGGPYDLSTFHFFPRVEAITASGTDDPSFVFFGLRSTETDELLSYVDPYNIRCARASATSPPATLTEATIATLEPPTATSGARKYLYDTHSAGDHTDCYVVYSTHDGQAGGLQCMAVGISGELTQLVKTGASTAPQVWHDEDTQTVLVSESGTWDSMFYSPEALGAFTEVTGLHAEAYPFLYDHADGELHFSGEAITLTGTNPAVPSFTGTADYPIGTHTSSGRRVGAYDPQPWTGHGRAMLFPFYNGARRGGLDEHAVNTSSLFEEDFREGTHISASHSHSDDGIYPVVPVLQTRHGLYVYDGFLNASSGQVGHVPQTAVDASGRVLVPGHAGIAAAKAFPSPSFLQTFPALYTRQFLNEGGFPNMDRRVLVVRLSPRQTEAKVSTLDHFGTTLIAAGALFGYDGRSYFEPPAPPVIVHYDDSSSSGTGILRSETQMLATANYALVSRFGIKCVLVFTDKNGLEWRSGPSAPFGVTSLAGVTTDQAPLVRLELNEAHRRMLERGGSFDVEMYVSERDVGLVDTAAGASDWDSIGTYYFAQRTPLLPDPVSSGYYMIPDFLRFAHNGSYFPAIPLYTAAGELAPSPPPATSTLARAGNYLFLVPDEFRYELWPSKPREPGRGPEWAPELVIPAPADCGGIVSIAGQGDRLVLLCANGVYELFVGDGPDATGAGGFGAIRLLHAGDGCVNQRATLSTPAGVFYAAKDGLRLVDGGGGVHDVGADVAETLGDTESITSACYLSGPQEAWFHTSGGRAAIYNLERGGAWTMSQRLYTPGFGQHAVEHLEEVHQVASDGDVFVTSRSTLKDEALSTTTYPMTVTTPWLSFGHPMGFVRCRRIHVLVRHITGAGSKLRLELAYDYVDTTVDTLEIDPSVWTTLERGTRFTVRPSRQKFAAVRIKVTETDIDGPAAGAWDWALSGLELELASKQGGIKLQVEAKA